MLVCSAFHGTTGTDCFFTVTNQNIGISEHCGLLMELNVHYKCNDEEQAR